MTRRALVFSTVRRRKNWKGPVLSGDLIFDPGPETLRTVVAALLELPDGLRPDRHSLGEDERGKPIEDVEEYLDGLSNDPVPPFLRGEGVSYNISAPGNVPVKCDCELHGPPHLVETFLTHMAAANPVFGYACTWEELEHRNHLVSKIRYRSGVTGTSEQFIGRDTSKYVPGLYWLTLLPEALASRHGVPLAEVAKVALEHTRLAGGQHLFRFHERPEDWAERRQALDEVCASLPGVFNIADVKPLVAGVTDDRELSRIVSPWR